MSTNSLPKINTTIPLNKSKSSDSSSEEKDQSSPEIEENRYTSLKDILLSTSPPHGSLNNEGFTMIDSSNISIRNELVKHAASAYVQSTAILANRDEQWLSTLWERIRNRYVAIMSHSCWYIYVRIPLREFFNPIFQFLDYVVNRVTRVLSGGGLDD